MATPITSYFSLTTDNVIDSLTNGYRWSLDGTRTVDYSISGGFSGEFWNAPATVAQYMGAALNTFSYYANINFNYVGSFSTPTTAGQAGSEINLSLDGANRFFSSTSSWAVGFFPSPTYALYQAGDVFLNIRSAANTLPSYEPGSQGWFLLLHELGHTLGLKHPHDSGGTGRPTFAQVGELSLDTDLATIMSYNDDGSWNQFGWDPATPMILDVLAIQALYGKNLSTNAGNTTFQLSQTNFYTTLWDASGIDTLDASSSNSGWTIYLPNRPFATVVDTKVGIAAPTSDFALAVPHTVQWLAGDYENIIDSRYSDVIVCNDLDNTITCNGGNDEVDGGSGIDTVIFSSARNLAVVNFTNGTYSVTTANGTSLIKNVENFIFSGVSYSANSLLTPITPITYKLTSSPSTISEGGTANIILETTGLAAGTSLPYSISGIASNRLAGGSLNGNCIIGSDGKALISLSVLTNNQVDSQANAVITVGNNLASTGLTISDQAVSIGGSVIHDVISVSEGSSVLFTFQSNASFAGSVVSYAFSGVSSDDIVGGLLSGTFTLDSRGAASVLVSITKDNYIESETLTMSVGGAISSIYITDTSISNSKINSLFVNSSGSVVSSTSSNDWIQGTYKVYGAYKGETVIYGGNPSSYKISSSTINGTPSMYAYVSDTVPGRDGIDSLLNIERIKFLTPDSGTGINAIALDRGPTEHAGSVYMLYKAAFNRSPDASGMGYWLSQVDGGKNIITDIAAGFVNAPEFASKYGALNNSGYVDALYQNVLGRVGESAGVAYWNRVLNEGSVSKAYVLQQFATLPEGAQLVAPLIANGIAYKEWVG